jgi:hypothetical protein
MTRPLKSDSFANLTGSSSTDRQAARPGRPIGLPRVCDALRALGPLVAHLRARIAARPGVAADLTGQIRELSPGRISMSKQGRDVGAVQRSGNPMPFNRRSRYTAHEQALRRTESRRSLRTVCRPLSVVLRSHPILRTESPRVRRTIRGVRISRQQLHWCPCFAMAQTRSSPKSCARAAGW